MKMLNKSCSALLMSASLLLGFRLCESTANAAGYVVSNTNGSGAGSLRAAIISANSDGVDSDITFAPTAFSTLKTVALGGTELGLASNGRLSITGPAAGVEISGNSTNRVFSVGGGADVTLNKLTITRGKADRGAGIHNSGTLTLNNCTFTVNEASEFGGGVYNVGNLTVNYCLISGNTAIAQEGGGIHNGNDAGTANATLTMTGSLLRNNKAVFGGGLSVQYAATTTVKNCTIYSNVANERGAGVYNGGGTSLTNCTFVVNTNLGAKSGAGLYGHPYASGGTSLTNCLGVQNAPDNFNGSFGNNGGNVQASSVQEAGLNSTGLANNGGPTETVAIVSRGTAVNAGVNSAISGFPNDQRGAGYPRIVGGSVDSGAYESSFTPTLVNNTGLTVTEGSSATLTEEMLKATDPVTNPLIYTLTTGPSHGTVRLNGNPTNTFTQNDIAAGIVSYTQDGTVAGSDSFVFQAGDGKGGYVAGTFEITILEKRSLIVTTTEDSEVSDGKTSLREAINFANEDGVDSAITFDETIFAAPRKTITLRGEQLPLIMANGTLSITAPAAGVILNGNGASNILETQSDASIIFRGLTISGGNAESGGGIHNTGTLLVDSCTLTGNSAGYGGAIYSANYGTDGALTVRNSTLAELPASVLLRTVGLTRIESSTITGNSAPSGSGGGIVCPGDMFTPVDILVSNSIIAGNNGTDVDYVYGNNNSDNIQSNGNNLIGDGSAKTFFYEGGDTVGQDPKLGSLGENGGPTQTIAPLPGSPAVDRGNTQFTTDQRGFVRPLGNADDIGAYESEGVKPSVTVTNPSGGQVISIPTWSSISGGAKDNVGVKGVQFKLFRTRNGVTTYWNGEEFVSTSFLLSATVASPGSINTTWSYEVSSQLRAAVDAGTYTIYAYATDIAGNMTSAYGRNFTLSPPDTAKPTVTVTNPSGGQVIPSNAWSSISGGAKDNVGVTEVRFKLFRTRSGVTQYWNGESFGSAPEMIPATVANPGSKDTTWSYSIPASLKAAVDAGTYIIYAYASDAAGNTTSAYGRNFTISLPETVKPTVTVTNPSGGQVIPANSWSAIEGGAKDNVGVTQVQFKLFRTRSGVRTYWNGADFGSAPAMIPAEVANPGSKDTTWSYSIPTSLKAAVDAGAYTIYAYASDAAGNMTSAFGRNFTISVGDDVKPTVSVTNPFGGQVISAPTWSSISGGTKDNLGVAGVQFKLFRTRNGVRTYWNGSSFGSTSVMINGTVASPGSTNTTWSFNIPSSLKAAVDSGAYTLYAYSTDVSGNTSSAFARNFTITTASGISGAEVPAESSLDSVSAPSGGSS